MQVLQRGPRDLLERFPGEERLVRGNQHVGECHEPGDLIVLQNLFRMVAEEEIPLLLVNVDAEVAQLPLLQRRNHIGGVDERPPGWC